MILVCAFVSNSMFAQVLCQPKMNLFFFHYFVNSCRRLIGSFVVRYACTRMSVMFWIKILATKMNYRVYYIFIYPKLSQK